MLGSLYGVTLYCCCCYDDDDDDDDIAIMTVILNASPLSPCRYFGLAECRSKHHFRPSVHHSVRLSVRLSVSSLITDGSVQSVHHWFSFWFISWLLPLSPFPPVTLPDDLTKFDVICWTITNVLWIRNWLTLLHMRQETAACALTRWQHFSEWKDTMAVILKVRYVKSKTMLVNYWCIPVFRSHSHTYVDVWCFDVGQRTATYLNVRLRVTLCKIMCKLYANIPTRWRKM